MQSAKFLLIILLCVVIAVPSGLAQQAAAPATPPQSTSEQPKPNVFPVKHTPDGKLILEDGIPVRLRLTRTLSSADAKAGDRVDFEVLDAVKLGDTVVIPQGSIAWATVTDAVSYATTSCSCAPTSTVTAPEKPPMITAGDVVTCGTPKLMPLSVSWKLSGRGKTGIDGSP